MGFTLLEAAKAKPQNPAGVVFCKKLPVLTSKLPLNLDTPVPIQTYLPGARVVSRFFGKFVENA
jgi:hypothetical protein